MKKVGNFIFQYRAVFLLFAVLVYTAYLHGNGMFDYPYYESDEGTYTSQAWSVVNGEGLAPYTYWYDHPPLGWLTLATWYSVLPDSYFTFGNSIDTGRVLMLVFFLINTTLVFYVTQKLTKSSVAATLAAVFFSSSPLVIYFSRRVLLDNIQIFWLFASVVVLLPGTLSLRRYALSGILFGCAFLTKVTAVMFGPALLFLVLALKDKTHKTFRAFTWLGSAGITASFYFLYALVKNELFPPLFPDSAPHVSIWESTVFQMSRGSKDLWFFQEGSDFMNAFTEWTNRDPVFVFACIAVLAIGAITFAYVKNAWYRFFVLACLLFGFFLIRGGIVINFYFIPLVPFLSILFAFIVYGSMNYIGLMVEKNDQYTGKGHVVTTSLTLLVLATVLWHYNAVEYRDYFSKDDTANQIAAVNWIKENLPESADIIIDSTMYVELHDPKYLNDKAFENAEWFYKVSRDSEIREEKYSNNWQNFDYIALTHEMLKQIDNFDDNDLVVESFDNALPLIKWFENSDAFIDEQKRISTYGDWAMVYDINSQTREQLSDAWELYKENFIHSYGQVIDPNGDVTTSEGQSYAMLRAAWMNDHDTFKGVWLWTQHHLQHRLDDKLISWKWVDDQLVDSANATDADVDIALALLFGYVTFGEESYLEDAKVLINDIWEHSIVDVNGTYYLLSSNNKNGQVANGYLFNPSYMSPAHFRLFAEVDPSHDWNQAADDTYKILNALTRNSQTPLIKNWYVINPDIGTFHDASPHVGFTANLFSYDAFRVFWRVWLDFAWYNNQQAENYLVRSGNYLEGKVLGETVPTIINPVTGETIATNLALSIHSSYVLPLTLSADADVAREFFAKNIESQYKPAGYWGSPSVYYDQNWVWFNAAFYNNDLYNIWAIAQNSADASHSEQNI